MKSITLLILFLITSISHAQTNENTKFYTSTEFKVATGQYRVYKLDSLKAASGSCWEMKIIEAYGSDEWLASSMLVITGDEDSKFAKISLSEKDKNSDEVYVSFINTFLRNKETDKIDEFVFLSGVKIGEPVKFSITITKNNEVKIISRNRLYSYELGFSPVEISFGASSSHSTIRNLELVECNKNSM